MAIDGKTAVYGIIGNPVSHTLSPLIHNAAFAALGINAAYLPFPVEDVAAGLTGLRGLGVLGVSVTIPHKEAVIPLLDRIDPVAQRIGAVNTIQVANEEGRGRLLIGSNTDWLGANRALEGQTTLAGKRVILLGAGGSARAIGFGLQQAGARVTLCSRTEARGKGLAQDLGCEWCRLDNFGSLKGDVLVNATSVGMQPKHEATPVAGELLKGYEVVMDIVYAPLETRLLKEAQEAGCRVINGLEMLLYQGVAQFELWTGREAPVEVMRATLFEGMGVTPRKERKS